MELHCENVFQFAEWLGKYPRVNRVYYPGLPHSPPNMSCLKNKLHYFGDMISLLELKADFLATKKCYNAVEFSLAKSLGGVESLIEHPTIMTLTRAFLNLNKKKSGLPTVLFDFWESKIGWIFVKISQPSFNNNLIAKQNPGYFIFYFLSFFVDGGEGVGLDCNTCEGPRIITGWITDGSKPNRSSLKGSTN